MVQMNVIMLRMNKLYLYQLLDNVIPTIVIVLPATIFDLFVIDYVNLYSFREKK